MALEVMDADRRHAEPVRERRGDARADEQRAGEARTLGVGDRVEVLERHSGAREHALDERQRVPDVVARSELGHDAAVVGVHRRLSVHLLGEEAAHGVVHRHAGFVAGGFDPEHEHPPSVADLARRD